VTYGVPRCDDARYARAAAEAVHSVWVFYPLYSGKDPDWLERRSAFIQHTDGMLQLCDLMHYESLHIQRANMDVHFSGYIGDAACGSSFDHVIDPVSALRRMPFYGTPLGWTYHRALDWMTDQLAQAGSETPARYVLYDHKLNQSIHKTFQGYVPWLRVRKPFLDYELFDFFASVKRRNLPALYATMLKRYYPKSFQSIPHQQTGMPVLTPKIIVQAERARRYAWRKLQPRLAAAGIPARRRIRSYYDDSIWRTVPSLRARLTEPILAADSISCQVFGRDRVRQVVEGGWASMQSIPNEVIAVLYVYEQYHRELSGYLRTAKRNIDHHQAVAAQA
jgi:hypothetical protein